MDNQKSNNTAVVAIIALAIVLIVGMMCATVVWILERTTRVQQPVIWQQPAPMVQSVLPPQVQAVASLQTPAAIVKQEAEPVSQPPAPKPVETKPVEVAPAPTEEVAPPPPTVEDKPAPAPAPQSEVVKQEPPKSTKKAPPKEKADAKVGPDGLPLNRVTLPLGEAEEVEWQF